MANAFKGEIDIIINDITYPMIVDMGVIAEFESETGEDFMNLSVKAINTMLKTRSLDNALDRAEYMTNVISHKNASWLFYLAAKKCNKVVEFGEIQEAMFHEGVVDSLKSSYPLLFTALVEFAIIGKVKKKTKKVKT
jgi:hypothetical protein